MPPHKKTFEINFKKIEINKFLLKRLAKEWIFVLQENHSILKDGHKLYHDRCQNMSDLRPFQVIPALRNYKWFLMNCYQSSGLSQLFLEILP